MSIEKTVLCSPSKVRDFDHYFLSYPEAPLKTDLLLDLLLYPKVIISNVAYGYIFSQHTIERRQWKRAFEDLINTGAIEVVSDFPSKDEELRLLSGIERGSGNPPIRESAIDLAILTIHSQKRQVPLIFRKKEVESFDSAKRVVDVISDLPQSFSSEEFPESDPRAKAAVWMLKIKIPRLFVERRDREKAILLPGERIEDFIFIAPNDLVSLLKDRKAIGQLRNHILNLASLEPTREKAHDYIEQHHRFLKKKLKVADIIFNIIDLALLPVPPPFSTIGSLIGKGTKKLTTYLLSQPYRWLFFTEDINAKI